MQRETRCSAVYLWLAFFSLGLSLLVICECKGSRGGGGRGGGVSIGGRGFGSRGSEAGAIASSFGSSRGRRTAESKGTGKKIALGAAAAGAVGYAAYKYREAPHRFHSNPLDNPAFSSGGGAVTLNESSEEDDYKLQESSYYNRGEGFGMSAIGIIALILGIIGVCTLVWYCMEIGLPLWKDRQDRRTHESLYSKESHALQETPSTATPSP